MNYDSDRHAQIALHHITRHEWVEQATQTLMEFCLSHERFTTDNLWPLVPWPGNGRAMGTVVQHAIKQGAITKWIVDGCLQTYDHVSLAPPTTLDGHIVAHQGPIVIYRSLRLRVAS